MLACDSDILSLSLSLISIPEKSARPRESLQSLAVGGKDQGMPWMWQLHHGLVEGGKDAESTAYWMNPRRGYDGSGCRVQWLQT